MPQPQLEDHPERAPVARNPLHPSRSTPGRAGGVRAVRCILALALGLPAAGAQAGDEGAAERPAFADPAPPEGVELPALAPPEARAHPGHRFHAPPAALAEGARTEDWPAFLGPRRDGRSLERPLRLDWPAEGPPLVWEMERGEGYASPVASGGRLVFTHRVGAEVHVDCLDAETGERFWRFSAPTDYRPRYISDAGPRASPAIDGERLYVHGVDGRLHSLDLATGRVAWSRDLRAEFEVPDGFFGVVSSPLVRDGRLLLNLGAPGGPTVAAFDAATGRMVWGAGRTWGASCASPVVASVGGRERLFVLTGGESRPPVGGLMVLDPKNGSIELEYPFRSRTYESVNGATPVLAGDRVFLTAAYNTGSAALGVDEEGRFEELWKNRRFGVEFSTPVYVDGYVYAVDGRSDRAGAIVCLDPGTGEELARTDLDWEEEVPYKGERKRISFSIGNGSLLHAGGRLLCLGDNGHLLSLEAGPEGAKVLARASLFRANESWTPLVVHRGLLYACQNNRERFGDAPARLLCYDLRGE